MNGGKNNVRIPRKSISRARRYNRYINGDRKRQSRFFVAFTDRAIRCQFGFSPCVRAVTKNIGIYRKEYKNNYGTGRKKRLYLYDANIYFYME